MNNAVNDENKGRFNKNAALLVVSTFLVTMVVAFNDVSSLLYSTSVLNLPEHAPFDGTTYPIKRTPNWSRLTNEQRDLTFNQLNDSDLTDIPYYDPGQLTTKTDTLKWGNPVDDSIRNAKITYSTPYMGNYKLDGKEYSGSHLAVDIKVPDGTPVYAMANGVVMKSSDQSSGFGVHIVLKHNNFPSLDDPSKKIVIYSNYAHLSKSFMSVADVVTKGQQIGLSGHSGTSTTPHLHFQIDNDQPTYHPFWPFTWQQASAAGLDFFSAINAGLGQDLAKATTINPVVYVQKYMGTLPPMPQPVIVPEVKPEIVPEIKPDILPETPPEKPIADVAKTEIVATTDDTVIAPVVTQPEPVQIPPAEVPAVEAPVPEPVVTEPLATQKKIFLDIEVGSKYYDATKYLSEKGIVNGYVSGNFKPNRYVNRAESLKFILASINADLDRGHLPFSDVEDRSWYANYLYTALQRNIVTGNPDGTFKPGSTVNKAEFFKILFNGLSVDIDPVVAGAPYSDVPESAWFAPYIAYAKELKIIDPEAKTVSPGKGMTRGEVAEAMYKLMTMER